ncbi:PAS domain-containing hybrid sensor histidine kinase/response regulator [Gemmatimonas sp. UBA7669]|uniref:PAS domain-containing hybrid sensor histidine kinase/response regulator n=1 Tax=Gemmatimonas sp. UBA7669 TaxID=1946568 RepID=UPI0025BE501A|nr:PAS domain-containing sensor histidine kinase [Gemmatimonas sp. UBA7669]
MEPEGSAVLDWYSTLQHVDVGVVVQDPTHRIVFANAKATSMLGVSPSEFQARRTNDELWDVIDVNGAPVAPDEHPGPTALRIGKAVRDRILGVRRGDGTERVWIQVSAIPECDAAGAMQRVHITFSDVSATQQAFLSQEAEYQAVIRSMSEGVVVHEMDGRIRSANPSAERVLGLTLDEMTGRTPMSPGWQLTDEDGVPVAPDSVPREVTARTGLPTQRVLGVRRGNGERAWLEVRADPLRQPGSDALHGVVATFADITAERDAIVALQQSRQQVQRVLDAVPGVVYQYLADGSPAGRMTFVAGQAQELFGIAASELVGSLQRMPAIFADDGFPRLQRAIRHAVETRSAVDIECRADHPERGEQWIRIYGLPTETAEGLLFTGVMLDVTAQHRLADALRRTQRREAMADMAGGIAHNFNNMLAVILPNIQLAREDVQGDAAAHLDDAERAALNAADLVRRMLALGRAEQTETNSTVDLVAIAREALHICRQTFDRGIALDDDIAVDHAPVLGSVSTVQQLVLNLLLNARDAVQGVRSPALHLSLVAVGDKEVQLSIRDNGVGMTDEVQRRIGEPFFTTKAPGRGTGLGLASVLHAIGEAGGTWRVESVPGEGTTFHIVLPRQAAMSHTPAPKVGITPRSLDGTALVVDDEPMVRTALARQLSHCGMRAVLASGGADALAQLRAGIDNLRVIMLDLSMPGMSGTEALPQLRAIAPHVPVVVMSGHVPADATLDGAAAVLQKPMGKQELHDTLLAVLNTA